jgi:hypothetical protein
VPPGSTASTGFAHHHGHPSLLKQKHHSLQDDGLKVPCKDLSPPDDRFKKCSSSAEPPPKRVRLNPPPPTSSSRHLQHPSGLPPPPPLHPASAGSGEPTPYYPSYFMKGHMVELANGELKRVEEMRTEDFVTSGELSRDLRIDPSTVVRIEENHDKGTAVMGFSVGEQRLPVS